MPQYPLLNKALLSMVDMTSMALADTLHDELYRCIVGKKEATQNPEEKTGEE